MIPSFGGKQKPIFRLSFLVVYLALQIFSGFAEGSSLCELGLATLHTNIKEIVKTEPAQKPELAERLLNYTVVPLVGEDGWVDGFILGSKDPVKDFSVGPSTRVVVMKPDEKDFKFDNQTWFFNQTQYKLLDVGFKNFEAHSTRVNKIIIDHIENYPNQNLKVLYDSPRRSLGKSIGVKRWAMHGAVLLRYEETKPYLSREDLLTLERINSISSNNDVYGLTKDGVLILTIQVTYYGDRRYDKPNLRQILPSQELPTAENKDLFPFEYRFGNLITPEFREKLFTRFDPRYTCEIIRYSSFDPKIPIEIEDRFVLNLFKTIRERGMKHILIGVDQATARLFSYRYGFKHFADLPALNGKKQKEFLYYMDVDGPEFVFINSALTHSSRAVDVRFGGSKWMKWNIFDGWRAP
jgi:hypothetical protein